MPLKDMGRFSHEASMVDPAHRLHVRDRGRGRLRLLQVRAKQAGQAHARRAAVHAKVKNRRANLGAAFRSARRGTCEWVPIDDPTARDLVHVRQGAAKGGARFRRLEGAWWGNRTGYFLSTDGGSHGQGQVFEYDPRHETLKLIYDAPTATTCDNPDNMTVTPRGGLLLCEDNAGGQVQFPAASGSSGSRSTARRSRSRRTTSSAAAVQHRGARRRLPPERVGGRLLQPRRPVAVREHPDAGHHLRDHRTLGRRPALGRQFLDRLIRRAERYARPASRAHGTRVRGRAHATRPGRTRPRSRPPRLLAAAGRRDAPGRHLTTSRRSLRVTPADAEPGWGR